MTWDFPVVGLRSALCSLVLAVGPWVSATAQTPSRPLAADVDVRAELTALRVDLATLEGVLEGAVPAAERARVLPRVASLRTRLDAVLARLVDTRAPNVDASAPGLAALPMAEDTFARFEATLRKTPRGAARQTLISDAARGNRFSARQVRQLLDQLSFTDEKLQAVRILAPRLSDPENSFELSTAFRLDADRAAMRRILENATAP
jgi:hypothetical protein